jgi:outer membrane autotransporter protein
VHDGTVIDGIVAGGAGIDTSVYDIDTSAGIGAFTGFERLTKTGDGVLEVRGPADSDVTEVDVLGGTLEVTASGSIGSVTRATVGSGATLAIDGGFSFTGGADIFDVAGTVSSNGALDMLDGDDTLILHDGADLGGLASPVDGGAGTDALIAEIASSATLGGVIGFETLTKDGTGSLAVTGSTAATFESVHVKNGLLDVATGGQLVAQQASVDTGAVLNVDGNFDFTTAADTFEVAGTVRGSGPIEMLDGDDMLILHDGADLGALATAVDGGAGNDTLTADIATQATLGGAVDFENLVKQGEGRFTIAGPAASQFDSVQVHQGELEIAAGAVVDPASTVVDAGATLTVDGSYLGTTGDDSFDLSGTLAGAGNVDLLGGDDVLTINTGAEIRFSGAFDASTQSVADRFVLAGGGAGSFDAGLVGTVFTNFETFSKEGTGTWTLTGTGSNDWRVVEGSLVGGSLSFGGNIDVDNAGTVVFDQAADGTYAHQITGDGTLVKRNAGTLALTGDNGFSGHTRIEAGTLQVDGSLSGDLAIASGATLSGIGTVGNVSAPAGSFVAPGNAAYPFNTLTVAGDFAGGGTVRINTVLGDEQSDTGRLRVQGDVSGRSALLVNRWSGDGAMTQGDGIQVVQVDGKSAADSFSLAKPVQAGAYEYLLYQGGDKDDNDWYLRSELVDGGDGGNGGTQPPAPAFRLGVPGYVLGHQLNLEYGFSALGDLRSRVGDQGSIADDGRQHPADFWARVYAHDLDVDGTRFAAHESRMFATQIGMDVHSTTSGNASTHVGLMASVGGSRATLSDSARARVGESELAGRMESRTKGMGTYWTHFGANGGYIDLAGQVLHYRNRYRDVELGAGRQSGWGGTASVEIGKSMAMGASGWFVQPELQLAYQHLSLDRFTDDVSTVGQIDDNALRARAAVRFARAPTSWLGMSNASPYIGLGMQRDYRDAASVTIGGTTLNDAIPDTTGDLSVGFTGTVTEGVELHFDTRYQKSTHGRRDGVRANLGIRVAL